jgi:16S rRNA A1518/A1519 N6-dimethyltransferase RsmA/KsgA/DIM1 with predicted DNA glycosylase/AP lyase activity
MNPKKSLGQHWLTDEVSIKAIAAAGELSKSDTVLEVGPGLGSLTRELVKTASSVIAVELDELLAEKLPSAVKADNLKLVKGSILEFDTTSLPQGYTPPPKIDSQVVILKLRPKPLFKDLDSKLYFRIVKAGFAGRRKKLRGSLAAGLGKSKTEADKLLDEAGISGDLRAQNLSLNDWHKLYIAYKSIKM